MNNIYSIDYFITKFSAIPDERWTTGNFFEPSTGRRCALGHCGISILTVDGARREVFADSEYGRIQPQWVEAAALADILGAPVGPINNDDDPRYTQPTPKARILAALYDAKAKAEAALEAYEDRPLTLTPKPVEAI